MAPETSMEVQAALNSDLALVFDECTPFHVDRDYTARSTERTHRWLDRCLGWHAAHGPEGQLVYGIVQGGVFEDLRVESAADGRRQRVRRDRHRRLARRREGRRCTRSWGGRPRCCPRTARATCSASARSTTSCPASSSASTRSTARCPRGSGRHGMALVPDPERRWRIDLSEARWQDRDDPTMEGCPCPTCALGYTRGYLRYLAQEPRADRPAAATLSQPRVRRARHAPACATAIGRDARRAGRGRCASRRCALGHPRRRRRGPPEVYFFWCLLCPFWTSCLSWCEWALV